MLTAITVTLTEIEALIVSELLTHESAHMSFVPDELLNKLWLAIEAARDAQQNDCA